MARFILQCLGIGIHVGHQSLHQAHSEEPVAPGGPGNHECEEVGATASWGYKTSVGHDVSNRPSGDVGADEGAPADAVGGIAPGARKSCQLSSSAISPVTGITTAETARWIERRATGRSKSVV